MKTSLIWFAVSGAIFQFSQGSDHWWAGLMFLLMAVALLTGEKED